MDIFFIGHFGLSGLIFLGPNYLLTLISFRSTSVFINMFFIFLGTKTNVLQNCLALLCSLKKWQSFQLTDSILWSYLLKVGVSRMVMTRPPFLTDHSTTVKDINAPGEITFIVKCSLSSESCPVSQYWVRRKVNKSLHKTIVHVHMYYIVNYWCCFVYFTEQYYYYYECRNFKKLIFNRVLNQLNIYN